jgi:hypothetical protein
MPQNTETHSKKKKKKKIISLLEELGIRVAAALNRLFDNRKEGLVSLQLFLY